MRVTQLHKLYRLKAADAARLRVLNNEGMALFEVAMHAAVRIYLM